MAVAGGTGNAWANPQPAATPRRLLLAGGFVVDGGRDRHLDERARVLGFEDLRGYLQARCDAGHSIPRSPPNSGWATGRCSRRWRGRGSGWRPPAAAGSAAAALLRGADRRPGSRAGLANVGAYLVDRVLERGWLLAEVATELAAHRVTVRWLLERYGIRRVRRTPRERAAAEAGRHVQAVGWQARRMARLAELGFQDLAGYLKARHVEQGWSVKRMRAELGVGRRWLVGELSWLGLRP
jgi:hypothetical protein